MLDRRGWVLGKVLESRADTHGDKPFLRARGRPTATFAQVDEAVNRVANGLVRLGVSKGDNVLIMLPNCLEFVYSWFALSKLGAVEVPINTAYKGAFLEHIANNSRAKLIIVAEPYVDRIVASKSNLPHLRTVVVFAPARDVQPPPGLASALRVIPFQQLVDNQPSAPGTHVAHFDLGAIMYTSGTTGPSKGVMMSHAHMFMCALVNADGVRLTEEDVYYTCQPLFHGNAQVLTVYPALLVGAQAFIGERFSASSWVQEVCDSGATVTNVQGAMMSFIFSRPPAPSDRRHKLRVVYAVPAPPQITPAFMQRFGLQAICESYGQTEVGLVTFTPYGEHRSGSCGKAMEEWYEIRLVDPETDELVKDGEPGEVIVRPRQPWTISSGYFGMPEETLAAWRNLWYHTGDLLKRDADGYYYFVDRTKDRIRRRAENVSSSEVEDVLSRHEAIRECAVIAVKSNLPGGEDEVKACVVFEPGKSVAPEELLRWAEERMPYFAVPRYVEFLPELPRTPTEKIQKQLLRTQGINRNTWDREKAGFKLQEELRKEREKMERPARSI